MIWSMENPLVMQLVDGARHADRLLFRVPLIFCYAIIALLVWRVWRFKVQPIMHPDEPKEVPYWIPCKCLAGRCHPSQLT